MDRWMDEDQTHTDTHTRTEGSVSLKQLQQQSLICFVVKAVLFLISLVMEMLLCHTALEVSFSARWVGGGVIHFATSHHSAWTVSYFLMRIKWSVVGNCMEESKWVNCIFQNVFFGNRIHRFWFSIKSMKTYLLFQPLEISSPILLDSRRIFSDITKSIQFCQNHQGFQFILIPIRQEN